MIPASSLRTDSSLGFPRPADPPPARRQRRDLPRRQGPAGPPRPLTVPRFLLIPRRPGRIRRIPPYRAPPRGGRGNGLENRDFGPGRLARGTARGRRRRRALPDHVVRGALDRRGAGPE